MACFVKLKADTPLTSNLSKIPILFLHLQAEVDLMLVKLVVITYVFLNYNQQKLVIKRLI